ncbi:uncharacterized protein FOBCDRAFT_209815 [Fusarium oxysporum Fo47]|uniref:uncharacterized protein n=1 Tax=Fusarium oxysporum Fo47 TaxID=660027 RepID=UPI002869DB4D|nr:uncharacterized protein FOBCDRAFT_209815 [Fusarium oxysporum Fo47]WJG37399.1 hypothetical protein FOBCDRAFT_209815 [Fusarium oxysporum Fo47]
MTELGDQFLEWVQKSIHALGGLCDCLTRNPTTVAPGGISYVATSYEGLEYLVNVQLRDLNIDPFELTGILPCPPLQEGVLQSSYGYEAAWIWKFYHPVVGVHKTFSTILAAHPMYCGDVMQNVPQFSDVVRHIKRRPMSETRTFWTPFLHGVEPCQIPVSKLCQNGPELDIHNTISIPFESMTGVTEQCKQVGLTLSTFVHLAWALVLSYVTVMDETFFGYIISGRDVPVEGIGRIFGPMANILINHADLGESLEADAALIARNLKSHRRHQQTSLAEIHHDLGNKDERRQLFNTIVSLLRSNLLCVKRLYFAKYHQSRRGAKGRYDTDMSDSVLFVCRARFCVRSTSAMIDSSESEASVRPQDRFFRYVTGKDRRATSNFWKSQLAGLDPSDPTTRDRSTAAFERDQHMKLVMQDIGNHSGFSTEVPGRAAWSMVLSQVFDSEDVIFVAVISHRRADDLLGIKIFPGVDTSVVPIRAYLD